VEAVAKDAAKGGEWAEPLSLLRYLPYIGIGLAAADKASQMSPTQLQAGSAYNQAKQKDVWNQWFSWTGVKDNPHWQGLGSEIGHYVAGLFSSSADKTAKSTETGAEAGITKAAPSLAHAIAAAVAEALEKLHLTVDVNQVGRAAEQHMSREVQKPPSDHSGFDTVLSPLFPAYQAYP
jgi:hypothetical protein